MIKWNTGMQIMRPQSMVKMSNLDEMDLTGYDSAVNELSRSKRAALGHPPHMSTRDAIEMFVGLSKTGVRITTGSCFEGDNSMRGECVVGYDDSTVRRDLEQMVVALGRMVDFSVTDRHEINSYTGESSGPQMVLEWVTSDGSLMQAIHGQMEDEKIGREIEKVQAKKRQVALTDAANAKIQAARELAERKAQYEEEAMF